MWGEKKRKTLPNFWFYATVVIPLTFCGFQVHEVEIFNIAQHLAEQDSRSFHTGGVEVENTN